MKRGFIFLIFIVLVSFNVYGITLQPPKIELEFQPNLEYSYSFNIKNDYTDKDMDVYLFVNGDLNESFILDKDEAKIPANTWQLFNFKINMPNDIEPGDHAQYIVINEGSKEKGVIGAVTGIALLIVISKPYPGKYLSVSLDIPNGEVNKDVDIKLNLQSKSTEIINSITGKVDVYDSKHNLMGYMDISSGSIKPGETKEIITKWKTDKPGIYLAEASVDYDGNTASDNRYFNVGDLLIEIVNVSVDPVTKGDVAIFEVNIKSLWNSKIENVYLEANVENENSKSESFTLEGWETRKVILYLDTNNLEEKEYDALIKLNYEGKSDYITTKLIVNKKINWMILGLIIIVIILLIITYFNLKRTLKKNVKKKEK